ncbi:unnamed protein product, partial [Prorocentrum cordatum]
PDVVDIVVSEPKCMLDPWSKQMLESGTPGSDEFRHRLELHAEMAETNISPVEGGHAHVHRFVKSRVQTHPIDMPQLSAQWSGYHIRSNGDFGEDVRGRAAGEPRDAGHGRCDGDGQHDDVDDAVKKKGGGPWRAYLRIAHTNDLREAAVAYNALPRDSELYLRCLAEGREATENQGMQDNETLVSDIVHEYPAMNVVKPHLCATPLAPELNAVVLQGSATAMRAADVWKWAESLALHKQNVMQ